MSRRKLGAALALCVAAAVSFAAYAATAKTTATPKEVVLGLTNTMTGPLGPFGNDNLAGVKEAVDEVNKEGGVTIGGKKVKVKLVALDNKSDPNVVAANVRELFLSRKAAAVVSAWTPLACIPASNVAEQLKRPVMNFACPIQAWLDKNPKGWKWAWDIFFDENEFTQMQYKTANLVSTNKKVAIFATTEDDGVMFGGLWERYAVKYGYQVVYHAKFPPGTTEFSSHIKAAKAEGAEILLGQMLITDGIALWKQMKALGWVPKLAFCEKCASPAFWEIALGPIAQGTLVNDGGWSAVWGRPGTDALVKKYLGKLPRPSFDGLVQMYNNTRVLLDAISAAGSTDPKAINTALANLNKGKTKKVYVSGPVEFNAQHYYATPSTMLQIQGNDRVQVWAPGALQKKSKPIQVPPPGLQ